MEARYAYAVFLVAALFAAPLVAHAAESAAPESRAGETKNFKIDQFAHFFSSIADNSALYGNKSTVSKNFYVDTLNPAQVFLNYGQDVYARTPCTMSSPHYHAAGGELSLSIGPDDSQYVLMISEDMTRPMFFHLKPFTSVMIPPGWLHAIINTCGRTRTVATFGVYDQGNTIFPWATGLTVDPNAVELYGGATKEDFARIYKWVQGGNPSANVPFNPADRDRALAPACLEWCKANKPAAFQAKPAAAAPVAKPAGRRLAA